VAAHQLRAERGDVSTPPNAQGCGQLYISNLVYPKCQCNHSCEQKKGKTHPECVCARCYDKWVYVPVSGSQWGLRKVEFHPIWGIVRIAKQGPRWHVVSFWAIVGGSGFVFFGRRTKKIYQLDALGSAQ